MLPVKTGKTDQNFGPPEGHEKEIGNLPYYWSHEHGFKEVVSVWEPSEAERRAIAAGCNVRLGVGWLGAFPPITLGVTHEKGELADNPQLQSKPKLDDGRIHG